MQFNSSFDYLFFYEIIFILKVMEKNQMIPSNRIQKSHSNVNM